jgi:hypothetical protein
MSRRIAIKIPQIEIEIPLITIHGGSERKCPATLASRKWSGVARPGQRGRRSLHSQRIFPKILVQFTFSRPMRDNRGLGYPFKRS